MISEAEVAFLRLYIAAQHESATSPLDRLWAGRCAALLVERQRLEEQVEVLTREVDAALEGKASGTTWVF